MGLFRRGSDQASEVTPSPSTDVSAQATVESPDSQLELQQLRSAVEEIHRVIVEVADRGTAQEKVLTPCTPSCKTIRTILSTSTSSPSCGPFFFCSIRWSSMPVKS
jgi:hypothetical protein